MIGRDRPLDPRKYGWAPDSVAVLDPGDGETLDLATLIREAAEESAADAPDDEAGRGQVQQHAGRRLWAGLNLPDAFAVDLASKGKGKGKKCGNSYVSPSYTCRDDNPRSFVPDDPSSNNKDLFYDFADTVPHPTLAAQDAQMLDAYTEGAYRNVNAQLRGQRTDGDTVYAVGAKGEEIEVPTADAIAGLDGAFKNAPELPEPVVTFRGGKIPTGVKPGDEFTDAGFVSTGGAPGTAVYSFWASKRNDPTYAVMEIVSPKGTRAIIPDIALKRPKGDRIEGEMLLNRGSRFRVRGRRLEKYPFGDTMVDVPIVELEVVP